MTYSTASSDLDNRNQATASTFLALPLWMWAILAYLAIAIVTDVLHYTRRPDDFVIGDATLSIRWSYSWWAMKDAVQSWLPLNAIVIWAFRMLTFRQFSDPIVLRISALFFGASSIYMLHLLLRGRVALSAAAITIAIFAFYPFGNTDHSWRPMCDTLATFTVLWVYWAYVKDRPIQLIVVLALALICHKGYWPTVGLLAIFAALHRKMPWYGLLLMLVPLGGFWAMGIADGKGVLWFFTTNVDVQVVETGGGFALFNGIRYSLLTPDSTFERIKGVVCVLMGLVAFLMLILGVCRYKSHRDHSVLAIAGAAPVIVLVTLMNEHELFASCRFGHLLMVPLGLLIAERQRLASHLCKKRYFAAAAAAGFVAAWGFTYAG